MPQTSGAAELLPYLDRVTHGDCIAVLAKLPPACVDLVVTDPPYLVGYRERNGRPVGNDDNDAWLLPAFRAVARVMRAHSLCASFYGWPHADRFLSVWKTCGLRPVSHLVWLKSYTCRAGYTHTRHETGYLLAKADRHCRKTRRPTCSRGATRATAPIPRKSPLRRCCRSSAHIRAPATSCSTRSQAQARRDSQRTVVDGASS